MRLISLAATSLIMTAGCSTLAPFVSADALDSLQRRVIRVSERVKPSVVHIEAAVRMNTRRNLVTGSGFIMNKEGIVLTNEHVVERAEKVSVVIPGHDGRYPAEVVGTDKQTDLAVLRISPRDGEKPFPVAALGDSDSVQVGEWVIAIGNPYGLEGTVSLGIISAKGRDRRAENLLNDFIQTDAMIDRGSSGGPLVNLRSEVVGINSRGQGRGIGFTIPINTAKRVAGELVGDGKIARGYLGVSIQPLSRELAQYWEIPKVHGVVVNGVVPNSPAAEGGLEIGDIVSHFRGERVRAEKDEDTGQFQRLVALTPIGDTVPVEILRAGERQQLDIKMGRQPKLVPDEEESSSGFTVQEVTQNLIRTHRLRDPEGVLVSFVERGSEAAEAGMARGDLIVRIGETSIIDIESFREAAPLMLRNAPFLIEAKRGNDKRFFLILPRGSNDQAQATGESTGGGD